MRAERNSIREEASPARRYLTPAEVARLVGVSATTVTRWAREGKLACQVTLGGHRRFDPAVVEALRGGGQPAPVRSAVAAVTVELVRSGPDATGGTVRVKRARRSG